MKKGLVTSVVVHTVVLGGMLVSFSSPMPLDATMTEALPVSLVPVADEMSARKGEETALKKEKPAPKPTIKPPVQQEGKNVGDNKKLDIAAPVNEKVKQERKVDMPPPSSGKMDAGTPPALKEPEKPKEVTSALPASANAPTPAVKPSPPQSQIIAKNEAASQLEKPKPAPLPKGETLDNILAKNEQALVDRTKTSGGGTRRSKDLASFGSRQNIGSDGDMKQIVSNIIGSCVTEEWLLPGIERSTDYDLSVVAEFRLNRDGSLNGEPKLTPAGHNEIHYSTITFGAREAIMKCVPAFAQLAGKYADKYDEWANVAIRMRAFGDE